MLPVNLLNVNLVKNYENEKSLHRYLAHFICAINIQTIANNTLRNFLPKKENYIKRIALVSSLPNLVV